MMFQQKDNYTYRLTNECTPIRMPWDHRPLKLKYFNEFTGKTYCLIQRVNAGYKPDEWDEKHDCIRGDMIARILDLQLSELSNRTTGVFHNDVGCFLRLQDPEGNTYEALQIVKKTDLDLRAVIYHICLSDELRKKLENDSYYPYAGPLRRIPGANKSWENTKEVIKLTPLDNLQAMEAMERMKKYREESENLRKQDAEREAAIRREQEEARLAELAQQNDYAARNAAVDQSALDRMFRSSGK